MAMAMALVEKVMAVWVCLAVGYLRVGHAAWVPVTGFQNRAQHSYGTQAFTGPCFSRSSWPHPLSKPSSCHHTLSQPRVSSPC